MVVVSLIAHYATGFIRTFVSEDME